MTNFYPNMLAPQGWECPKCGSVYSPVTSKCYTCTNLTFTSTTTTEYQTTQLSVNEATTLNKIYGELSVIEDLFGRNSTHKAYTHVTKRMKEILAQLENKNG